MKRVIITIYQAVIRRVVTTFGYYIRKMITLEILTL